MAQQTVSYNEPSSLNTVTAVTLNSATAADILTITDLKYLKNSQFSIYFDVTLGTNTSLTFRYFYTTGEVRAGSVVWYAVPIKDLSSGILVDRPTVINSTSPLVSGSTYRVVEDLPMSGCSGFKITGFGTAGSGGLVNHLEVFGRDN